MLYDGIITCPFCNYKGKDYRLIKEWIHGLHRVNRVECLSCKNEFRFYWGERKDGTFRFKIGVFGENMKGMELEYEVIFKDLSTGTPNVSIKPLKN
ncbi:hypothetical protein ACNF40_06685 [Cuniculiplasma sp. SKW4]|uniref:hypothetical protein n=1 Tax=Cuniculiplasma sp. SKW4 TaxID=3400171 RepID=UPI003FCFB129